MTRPIVIVEPQDVLDWELPVTEADVWSLYAKRDEPGQRYYLGRSGEQPMLHHGTPRG